MFSDFYRVFDVILNSSGLHAVGCLGLDVKSLLTGLGSNIHQCQGGGGDARVSHSNSGIPIL